MGDEGYLEVGSWDLRRAQEGSKNLKVNWKCRRTAVDGRPKTRLKTPVWKRDSVEGYSKLSAGEVRCVCVTTATICGCKS